MSFTRTFRFLLALLITIPGCKEEEPYLIVCESGLMDWDFLPAGPYQLRNVGDKPNYLPNVKLIIQTQADFEYYLKPAGLYPTIDFKRKTLLLVRTDEKLAFQGTQKLMMDCDKKQITWRIDALRPDNLPQFPELDPNIFGTIVPKISEKTEVVFLPNILD